MADGSMSSRQRYLTTFGHEEGDRVPIDLGTTEGFRFPGEPWRRGPLGRAEAILAAGGDPCLDIWLPAPAFDSEVTVSHGRCGSSDEAMTIKKWAAERDLLLRARRTFRGESGMWFMRFEDYLMATVADATLVDALLEVVGDWQLGRAELALEIGVDVLMHRGYYETPEYFSPERYDRFCRPFIEKLGKMTREAGALFALQRSEGNTTQVDLLAEMPVDILIDVEPGVGGEDLGRLKEELAGKTTLWGGVDSTLVINRGTAEDIDNAVRKAIEQCAAGGGFVIKPVAWIESDTPYEKVQLAAEACKRHGAYRRGVRS